MYSAAPECTESPKTCPETITSWYSVKSISVIIIDAFLNNLPLVFLVHRYLQILARKECQKRTKNNNNNNSVNLGPGPVFQITIFIATRDFEVNTSLWLHLSGVTFLKKAFSAARKFISHYYIRMLQLLYTFFPRSHTTLFSFPLLTQTTVLKRDRERGRERGSVY